MERWVGGGGGVRGRGSNGHHSGIGGIILGFFLTN